MNGKQRLCGAAQWSSRATIGAAMAIFVYEALPHANANELLDPASQEGGPPSFTNALAAERDSIHLRFGGLSVSVRTEADIDQSETQSEGASIMRSAFATELRARDSVVHIRPSSQQLSPIAVRADELRVNIRKDGDEHVLLSLVAMGNVRMTFSDADARCAKATASVHTRSSRQKSAQSAQEYAEIILDHDVDISRVREKDRIFIDGEHARIHIGKNGFSLKLSHDPLTLPLAGESGSEYEAVDK